jgi:hypothetical protein
MPLTPGLRKLALTAHVTCSVGWLGAVAGFLPIAIVGATSKDAETVRAAYVAMNLIGSFVLVPAALAALITGLIMSLGTKWGLVRHHWVIVKFVIALLATVILLTYMQTLRYLAGLAADSTPSGADLAVLRNPSHVVHASAALVALLVATTLSVYKPQGMTRYGQRKHDERRTLSDSEQELGGVPQGRGAGRTPGWVKVLGLIAIALVLLVIIGQLTGLMGRHGPGRHFHFGSDDHGTRGHH